MLRPGDDQNVPLPINRIEAFSDGIFAIIVTLLVFAFKIPEMKGTQLNLELDQFLWQLLPMIISYVISFITVAIFWVNHYQFFHWIKYSDRNLLWLNNLLLMTVAFVPFPTGLLGVYPTHSPAVMLYGAVLFLASSSFTLMRLYAKYSNLHKDLSPEKLSAALHKSFIGPSLYIIGIIIGAGAPLAAIAIYAIVPILHLFPFMLKKITR